ANGDDPPLRRVDVTALSHSRALLLEGGHPGPYLLLYGNPWIAPPSYDFADAPLGDELPSRVEEGRLGPPGLNPAYVAPRPPPASPPPAPPPAPRRSPARHDEIVTAALVVAAIALGGAGVIALRRPDPRGRQTG